MALIRARQPIVTRLTPHNGNKRFIVPNRKALPVPLGYSITWDAKTYAFGDAPKVLLVGALPQPFSWVLVSRDSNPATPDLQDTGVSTDVSGAISIGVDFAGNFDTGLITAELWWTDGAGRRGLSTIAHTQWTN